MDITPTFPSQPAEQEVFLPPPVSDAGSQPVGGFMAGPNGLSNGRLSFSSANEQILIGVATAPLVGAGIFIGRDTDGTYDFRAGDPSGNYMHYDASAGTLTIVGSITGGSLNINNNAMIDSNGNATFIGVTSLNMKSYTDFEASGRFVVTGDIAPTFGNNGMVVAPGTTSGHYSRALWWISNFVFNNNPSFTCSLTCLGGFTAGDGVGFIGLGNPTISGSGFTETGKNFAGFEFSKSSGVTTVIAIQCDGGGTPAFSGTLATLSNGDSLELFIKMTSAGIKYYTRLNGGSLSAATTLTTHLPTGGENYISFMSTNKSTTTDFQIQLQCAAYEH
jgi:hypothetical protein